MGQDMYEKGLEIRKEVLGAEYVEKALANAPAFSQDFQHYLTESCWGAAWAGDGLDRRQRSLLNLGMLAALGRMTEWELHFKGAMTNGLSLDELKEALLQIAVYCGAPAGVECFRIANRVLAELGLDQVEETS